MMWVVGVGLGAILFGVVFLVFSSNKSGSKNPSSMRGLEGEAQETFSTFGMVLVRGELWRARSKREIIQRGDRIRVVEAGPGLELLVEKVIKSAEKK
jgi:membrane-bound ClpP family serine protease